MHRCGGTIRARLPRRSRGLTYPPRVRPLPQARPGIGARRRARGQPASRRRPPPRRRSGNETSTKPSATATCPSRSVSTESWLYRHGAWKQMTPASNQKLVFSMALLQRTSPGTRGSGRDCSRRGRPTDGVLRGKLWIVGNGDPEVGRHTMAAFARAVDRAGIQKVVGRVMGATTGFQRDWWAPGWRDYFPRDFIPLPTALAFEGNEDDRGRPHPRPRATERRAPSRSASARSASA